MIKQLKLLINGRNHGQYNKLAIQNRIISAFTGTVTINNVNVDNFKIMSLDAVCDLFIGAIETGGVNKRNLPLYAEIKKFRETLPDLFDKLKVADSVCMDPENKNTYSYATANAQRNTIRKKLNEFRDNLTRIAWNAK